MAFEHETNYDLHIDYMSSQIVQHPQTHQVRIVISFHKFADLMNTTDNPI